MDFEKDYPDAKVVLLEQNYRSTKNILLAASGVIQQNKYRKKKDIWTENTEGEKVKVLYCENEYEEGDEIANSIRELCNKGISYSNIALFYRTNAQSRVLEISLRNHGIPYTIIGGVAFYQRKEIKDILSYLRLCINPHDEVALERTINTPARGIGNTTIAKLKEWSAAHEVSLFSALQQIDAIQEIKGKTAQAIKRFTQLISSLQLLPKSPVEDIIKHVIEGTRYMEFLRESDEREAKDRIANVEELVNAAHEYDINIYEGSLQGFLEEVALVSDADTLEDNTNCVTLMTLHTAKGLEYPVVFITGMEEGLLPHSESHDTEDEIEEERRLFYVGITRAMKELFITHASRRTHYGQTYLCTSSRFLDEIPDEILVRVNKTDRTCSDNFYSKDNSLTENKRIVYNQNSRNAFAPVSGAQTDTTASFSNGEIVRHPIFGVGRILEVYGSNDKASVRVNFNIGGTKNLMLAYAKLEKIK
jgi:DNA helicase-2/ATP-dependent DNA helicase PcrA